MRILETKWPKISKKVPPRKSNGTSGNKNEFVKSYFLRKWPHSVRKKYFVLDFWFDSLFEKFIPINLVKDAHFCYIEMGPLINDYIFRNFQIKATRCSQKCRTELIRRALETLSPAASKDGSNVQIRHFWANFRDFEVAMVPQLISSPPTLRSKKSRKWEWKVKLENREKLS